MVDINKYGEPFFSNLMKEDKKNEERITGLNFGSVVHVEQDGHYFILTTANGFTISMTDDEIEKICTHYLNS